MASRAESGTMPKIRSPYFFWIMLPMGLVSLSVAAPDRAVSLESAPTELAPGQILLDPDGRQIPSRFAGPDRAVARLKARSANPRSLASADFDEDGVPDVVAGFADGTAGIFTLHRGNVDAVFPNTSEARKRAAEGTLVEAPFLPDVDAFETPEPADYIGAGDFDADGHWDVVTARRGGTVLFLHAGDGTGGFTAPERIPLPGPITAFVAGEVNRRDGLTDIVVAIEEEAGARALVFEGPEGALRGEPEVIALLSTGTALVLGQIDDGHEVDLMIAAGDELVVVRGRDRRLSLDAIRRAEAAPLASESISLPFRAVSLTLGDFDAEPGTDVALLDETGRVYISAAVALKKLADGSSVSFQAANGAAAAGTRLMSAGVSSRKGDDLLLMQPGHRGLRFWNPDGGWPSGAIAATGPDRGQRPIMEEMPLGAEPAALLPMRLNRDAIPDLVVVSEGQTALSIIPSTSLFTHVVTNINDGGPGSLRAAILESAPTDSIEFNIPGPGPHIIVLGSPLPVIDKLTIDATTQPGFAGTPVVVLDGHLVTLALDVARDSLIRGLVINRVGEATAGVDGIAIRAIDDNVIAGNFIGTDHNGMAALPNDSGILVENGNIVGGTTSGARNLISGNLDYGVRLAGKDTLVAGNLIGVAIDGATELSNFNGIELSQLTVLLSRENRIGDATAGATNVISGNTNSGIVETTTSGGGHLIQGNLIGTDASGTMPVTLLTANREGINLFGAGFNTIGGTSPAARNVISGAGAGVYVQLVSGSGSLIQGNAIGTDITGTAAINSMDGIGVLNEGPPTVIGGAVPGARNLVSGNGTGIKIHEFGLPGSIIQGNWIGVDQSGTAPVLNVVGIQLAENTLVGGIDVNEGNVISGNRRGIEVEGGSSRITANRIGTDISGTIPIGNQFVGIRTTEEAVGNIIGAGQPGEANIIAYNGTAGVSLWDDDGQVVRYNAIFDNGGLGIDLDVEGVLPNDPLDHDGGPNNNQNYPVLTSAESIGGPLAAAGSLNSEPSSSFILDFYANDDCDASGHGEGQRHVGTTNVVTDAFGNATFSVLLGGPVSAGQFITATATHQTNGTSEFSQCRLAVGIPPGLVTPVFFEGPVGTSLAWEATVGSIYYHTYLGGLGTLPALLTGAIDSCRRWTTTDLATGNVLTEKPQPGGLLWYLVTAEGAYGEGSAGDATAGPRQLDSSGDCPGTCTHDKCTPGGSLDPQYCDACVSSICGVDTYCCTILWDGFCVEKARTVCGSLTCDDSRGQCAHSLCEEGSKLVSKCDDPPIAPSCVAQICAADPFCCEQSWDATCVGEVSLCGFNCD